MKTQLISQGNSWGFYINKTWSILMGITSSDYEVALFVEKHKLFIQLASRVSESTKYVIKKKLIRRGVGYTITLSQPILNLLDISPDIEMVEVNLEDGILTIEKAVG